MKRAASWLAAFVIALAAVVGLISFFNSRDESSLSKPSSEGPGKPYKGNPILSPADKDAVKRGNVVVLYRDEKPPAGTQELVPEGGDALEKAGQSVVLDREPTLPTALAAISSEKMETADRPQDLDEFIQYWLGS